MRVIRDFDLWFLIEDAKKYRMILYADQEYLERMQKTLYNLDVPVAYAVSDKAYGRVRSVYELLYEDPQTIMIIVAKHRFDQARKTLEGMGFRLGVQFKSMQRFLPETCAAPYYYDPVCGFNVYTETEGLQGFRVFGEADHPSALRIVTMGGSTTDAFLYPFRSWSEFLHERLKQRGIENVVFCGGVAGYRSSEELFKMIRDGIGLAPQLVLNFSGSNDLSVFHYPYINGYMRTISAYLKNHADGLNTRFGMNAFGVSWGRGGVKTDTPQEEDYYSVWFQNQKMIHAVCEAFGIRHLTFYQPNMCNGKKLTAYEQEYFLNACYWGPDRMTPEQTMRRAIVFRERVRQDAGKESWLADLSGIFDREEVYLDRLHVNETGNRLIAEHMIQEMERLCMIGPGIQYEGSLEPL